MNLLIIIAPALLLFINTCLNTILLLVNSNIEMSIKGYKLSYLFGNYLCIKYNFYTCYILERSLAYPYINTFHINYAIRNCTVYSITCVLNLFQLHIKCQLQCAFGFVAKVERKNCRKMGSGKTNPKSCRKPALKPPVSLARCPKPHFYYLCLPV